MRGMSSRAANKRSGNKSVLGYNHVGGVLLHFIEMAEQDSSREGTSCQLTGDHGTGASCSVLLMRITQKATGLNTSVGNKTCV